MPHPNSHTAPRRAILIVDEDVTFCRLIEQHLGRLGYRAAKAHCAQDALTMYGNGEDWLMLLDDDLPDMAASLLVDRLRANSAPAFAIMSCTGNSPAIDDLMRLGATDCLVKDDSFFDRLLPVIEATGRDRRPPPALRPPAPPADRYANVEAALSRTQVALWEWQVADGIFYINEQSSNFLDCASGTGDIALDNWRWQIHPEDRHRFDQALAELSERVDSFPETDYRIRDRQGRWRWLLQRGRGVARDARGNLERAAGTLVETTTQHALEAQLREAHKMEAIGRLAGGVAHDFNNLMTIVMGNCQLGLHRDEDVASLRRRLERIMDAARRAAELTTQLLAFGRKQVLVPRQVDLNEVVRRFAQMVRRVIGEDIVLNLIAADQPLDVLVDPAQIEQVLLNLAVNARDAMPDGGTLTIRLDAIDRQQFAATYAETIEGDRFARILVRDSGAGIDPRHLPHLFEPFFTTKAFGQATGLGLATAYGIVKQSGGHIAYSGRPGEGASFDICLPLLKEPAAKKPGDTAELPSHDQGAATILVVEDETLVREMACESLRALGYRVVAAANGQEALSAFDQPDSGAIDLVLSDVVMPAMGGVELAASIRRRYPNLPILFMSGYANRPGDGLSGHCIGYLQKPFSPARLGQALREILDKPNGK